jgi:hypothetical protein
VVLAGSGDCAVAGGMVVVGGVDSENKTLADAEWW